MPLTKEQQEKIRNGWRLKYGLLFPPIVDEKGKPTKIPQPDFMIEAEMFREGEAKYPKAFLGKSTHLKNFIHHIWGDPSDPDGYFQLNPNAEKIIDRAMVHKFLSCPGHASCSKTITGGILAASLYLIDPDNTKVLVTSMTIASAEGKIWGAVVKFWKRAARMFTIHDPKTGAVVKDGEYFLKGKLIASKHIIKRRGEDGTLYATEGIELVPAEAGEFKKSAKKIQGYKASGRIIVIGDEFATLAPNILETAKENLFVNQGFQIIAFFNPDSHYDPGGMISTPKIGWEKITPDMDEWETVIEGEYRGWCIRFDGTKSPNVLAGREIYRGLLTLEALNGYLSMYGGNQNSVGFWKMVRGFWSPTGSADSIYTEKEMESNGTLRGKPVWMQTPTDVAALDPAYTTGGDRAVGIFAKVGIANIPEINQVRVVLWVTDIKVYDEDLSNKADDKPLQVAKQFAKDIRERNIRTENVAIDVTGGHSFASLLGLQIGRGFLAVNFAGMPSDHQVSKVDKRKCRDAFLNLRAEMWYRLKHVIRSWQVCGLGRFPALIKEMCGVTYDESRGKIQVEAKEKVKARRSGQSCDMADAFFVLGHLCQKFHKLLDHESYASPQKPQEPYSPIAGMFDWAKKRKPRLDEPAFGYVPKGGGWADEQRPMMTRPGL